MAESLQVQVRMYRLGELGDCLLLSFSLADQASHMLIDCGTFSNSKAAQQRLGRVVKDIRERLAGAPLNVVVGTHQHNDHLSGFVHCEAEFKDIGVGQVWLSWLDNPRDKRAQALGAQHLKLQKALAAAHQALKGTSRRRLMAMGTLGDMLGFAGVQANAPVLPANAVAILKRLGTQDPDYLLPGQTLDLPGLPPGAVRVHVLGPPRHEEQLRSKEPRSGESYDPALAGATMAATKFLEAVASHRGHGSAAEEQYPFAGPLKLKGKGAGGAALKTLKARYNASQAAWRRIDDDWLGQAEALSLYLDSYTNNTSVVLAIELVDSGKVLLFAADAQRGNWVSWDGVQWEQPDVSTTDLLARTVLYKVGHHGSHNATLVDGLEAMDHPDLAALITVDRDDPNIAKANGWKMPARNLMKRLQEKTAHRVLRMDGAHAPANDPKKEPARSAWKRAGVKVTQTDLYMELTLKG